jgi:hypothetical protein
MTAATCFSDLGFENVSFEVFLQHPQTVNVSEGVNQLLEPQLQLLRTLSGLDRGRDTVVKTGSGERTPTKGKGMTALDCCSCSWACWLRRKRPSMPLHFSSVSLHFSLFSSSTNSLTANLLRRRLYSLRSGFPVRAVRSPTISRPSFRSNPSEIKTFKAS